MSEWARRRVGWLALCAGLWLAACAGLGVPRSIIVSEAELQAQLARRFPMQRSLLDTFDVQLSQPRLRLDAPANRLATELTVQGSDRRTGRSLQARIGLDYGLRYEPADGSVRLVRPRVGSFEFAAGEDPTSRRNETAQRMAIALAERLLDDLALYRIAPERLEALHAAGWRPGTLTVTPTGVEITIDRVPPAATPAAPP